MQQLKPEQIQLNRTVETVRERMSKIYLERIPKKKEGAL